MKENLSPEMNRRAWLWAVLIVLIMLALAVSAFLLPQLDWHSGHIYLPAEDAALLTSSEGLDSICIDASLDPSKKQLTFTQEMTLRNRTGQNQTAVVLRSWSGAYLSAETSPAASDELFYDCYGTSFHAGGLRVDSAFVDHQTVQWTWLDDARTVLTLPVAWPDGSTVSVSLRCTVQLPDCASRFGQADGIFMLGNVFPVAAVWQDGAWRTDSYCAIGDPFLSECANWAVTLRIPEGYSAAASAQAAPAKEGDRWVYRFTGKALRDFALVISRDFVSVQGMAGNTLVTAFAREKQDAQAMLRTARQAIESYEKRWGEYAWPTFTLTEAVFPYGGMEYPGMVMIASDVLTSGGQVLEYTVAHETAHQWWSVAVGSDGWYQPWQDESLCEYAWLDYVGDWYGGNDRERMAFDRIETSLRITMPGRVTPGSPIDCFADLTAYSRVVYQRGAALWCALETHMGKDALDAMLRDYQQQYRFRIASRDDLTEVINRHAGQDMSGLMLDYLDTYMD